MTDGSAPENPHSRPAQVLRRQARAGRHRPRRDAAHLDGGDRRLGLGQVGAAEMRARADRPDDGSDRDRRAGRAADAPRPTRRRCGRGSACCSRTARCSTACRSGRTSLSACWRSAGSTARGGARAGGRDSGPGRAGGERGRSVAGRALRRDAEARGAGPRHRRPAGHHVLRRADHRPRPDHGRGDRRADRRLREAARQHRGRDHARHGQRRGASATRRR